LTLLSGSPVMTASQAAKNTLLYSPYVGNQIPIWNGSIMVPTPFAEISVLTADTAKNPSAIGVSKVNDWFVWNDAGIGRLCHGPDWTNDTTRSAGTALARVGGFLTNAAAITNGPAIGFGTWVGTTRSNASSLLDYVFGSSAAGGGAALLNVWNAYNRVDVATTVRDSNGSWTNASATIRQSDGSNTNRVSFVTGAAEDGFAAQFQDQINTAATVAGNQGSLGVGLDSITAYDYSITAYATTAAGALNSSMCGGSYPPQLGYHFIQGLESSENGTTTFIGSGGGGSRYGLSVQMRM
jgi:hypothetical protein